ncbi:gluconate 2-dehydrogenase subunit 3 family protein [Caballeronia sp. LZ034LL]|uniref:gluconate 2-dehydrogenase subunit 3 family protein n=1 Tax=Caballeronia sp. LZ034LL TaxID=3038567 RepID=UPI0028657F43|nr:gluconate 2-dehydrogenase subunit 3 family protein [Caballeronia sp. LZ034LL]MDR5835669.1 gluconate 2-dehydrogenase subunit 3 family protein [Caballeronia sp. LZ034LL]
MTQAKDRSRRSFLKGSIAIAPIAVVGISGAVASNGQRAVAPGMPPADQPTADNYTPGYFTPEEWVFINAACDVLIPRDANGPGATELGVPQYIDRQMQTPYGDASRWYMQGPFFKVEPEFGYQSKLTPKEQYRLGIRAINGYCRKNFSGKTFAELTHAQQTDFFKKLEKGDIKTDDFNAKTFFSSFLLKNTMEGYFGDPSYGGNKDMASWKMIGYPGVRADYLEFVGEAKPYPYAPVSLYGKRG